MEIEKSHPIIHQLNFISHFYLNSNYKSVFKTNQTVVQGVELIIKEIKKFNARACTHTQHTHTYRINIYLVFIF